jgi:hypothetical protein
MRDMSEELLRTSKVLIGYSQRLREHAARLALKADQLREVSKLAASSAADHRSHADAARKRQGDR